MLVFGTRPEAIKMAPLVMELKQRKEDFDTIVCVTGQHREMLDQVLHIFGIKPDYDLNIMKQGQDLYDITARVLTGMRDILQEVKPDVVLVHGDTTTSTAAALAAFYQQIPVGHVEAGLRTRNIYSPWPEEMNRQLTGRIATYNFAPTPLSRQNLLDESVTDDKITVTGNTVIDALHWVVKKLKDDNVLQQQVVDTLLKSGYDVNRLNETVHRQSSNSKLSNSKWSNSKWFADGYDLQHVRIVAVDKKGRRVQTATDEVTFSIEGNAQIVGVINGDMNSNELTAGWSMANGQWSMVNGQWTMANGQWSMVNTRSLFNGTCTVILRSTCQPGPVTLTATAKDMKPVRLVMTTQ
jgi:DNA-binding winged helix-turn-helix (wHTH) protein